MSEPLDNRASIDIGLPDNMTFVDHGTYIEIVRKWFSWQFALLAVFAVFWNGALLSHYSGMSSNTPLISVLFPLLHVAAGIAIAYYALAGWFNRTHVYANKDLVGIRHRPIPWFGNKDIPVSNIKQLYVTEKLSRGRHGASTTYEVRVVTNSGRNIKLVGGLDNREQALYLEQKIEDYLDIEDQHVPGQVR